MRKMGSRLKTWKHFRKLQSRRQKVALENRFLEVAKKKRKGTQGQVPVLKDRLKKETRKRIEGKLSNTTEQNSFAVSS